MSAQDSNGTYAARLAGGGGLAGGLAGAVGEGVVGDGAGAGELDCLTSGAATITPFFTPCFSSSVFTLSSLCHRGEVGIYNIQRDIQRCISIQLVLHVAHTQYSTRVQTNVLGISWLVRLSTTSELLKLCQGHAPISYAPISISKHVHV